MATITIRNLPEPVRRGLKARAAAHNRSMEAEVRAILEDATATRPNFVAQWIASTRKLRGDFTLPERSAPRQVDLP